MLFDILESFEFEFGSSRNGVDTRNNDGKNGQGVEHLERGTHCNDCVPVKGLRCRDIVPLFPLYIINSTAAFVFLGQSHRSGYKRCRSIPALLSGIERHIDGTEVQARVNRTGGRSGTFSASQPIYIRPYSRLTSKDVVPGEEILSLVARCSWLAW